MKRESSGVGRVVCVVCAGYTSGVVVSLNLNLKSNILIQYI